MVAGVLVFAITTTLAKLALEPVFEVRRLIGRIAHALVFYADIYSNPTLTTDQEGMDTKRALRDLSSDLFAVTESLPRELWAGWAALKVLPPRTSVLNAAKFLIALSNGLRGAMGRTGLHNAEAATEIRVLLRITSA